MSEINAVEHVGKIFALAQRLMVARQALVLAKVEAATCERDLERLNGSTTIRLDSYEDARYFTCEAAFPLMVAEDRRQEAGFEPVSVVPCANVVSYSSWELDRGAARPKTPPICGDCQLAIDRAKPKPEVTEAKPPLTEARAEEIPF